MATIAMGFELESPAAAKAPPRGEPRAPSPLTYASRTCDGCQAAEVPESGCQQRFKKTAKKQKNPAGLVQLAGLVSRPEREQAAWHGHQHSHVQPAHKSELRRLTAS